MSPFPSFLLPSQLGIQALNSLLRSQPEARGRLQRHSGKTLAFALGDRVFPLTIIADGFLQSADPGSVPDVRFVLAADRLFDLPFVYRSEGPDAVVELMQIQGDAGLAHVVAELARLLRWDIEDSLARVVGDVPAMQLLSLARGVHRSLRRTGRRAAENMADYLVYEQRQLLDSGMFHDWQTDLQRAQQRLEALEQTVAQAEYRQDRSRILPC